MGKKTMFIAQGIGPLSQSRSRRLTQRVANRLNAITVRDQGSADLLKAIGVTKPPVTVSADPALLLGTDVKPAKTLGCAVSLRDWRDKTDGLISALTDAYKGSLRGVLLTPMSMHAGSDEAVNDRLIDAIGGIRRELTVPHSSLPDLLALASCAEMVIGMRLHALIFAAASATPMVAISYDPKVAAFMSQIGQVDLVYDLKTSPATTQLKDLIDRGWTERVDRRAALIERLPTLRAAAPAEMPTSHLNCWGEVSPNRQHIPGPPRGAGRQ